MMSDEELTWGAASFCTVKRRRLREKRLHSVIPIHHINFCLIGPTGTGKSSLIHTCWRALSGSSVSDPGLLERLRLAWSAQNNQEIGNKNGGLRAKHGTTELTSYALQTTSSPAWTSIFVQDTKGQQFFDEEETSFVQRVVHGYMRAGSTAEKQAMYFWAMLARAGLGGLVKRAKLAHSPHAIVLVFDLTLRSFQRAIKGQDNSLLDCYRQVANTAKELGLPIFAVLTHVDVYELTVNDSAKLTHQEKDSQEERRIGEDVAHDIQTFGRQLATAIGQDLLPADRIFPITNYHASANNRNDAIELAALDFLSAVVDAAEVHLLQQTTTAKNRHAHGRSREQLQKNSTLQEKCYLS